MDFVLARRVVGMEGFKFEPLFMNRSPSVQSKIWRLFEHD